MRNTKKVAPSVVLQIFIEDLLSLVCLCYIHIKISNYHWVGLKHWAETTAGGTDLGVIFLKIVVDFAQENKTIYVQNKEVGERTQFFFFFSRLKIKRRRKKQEEQYYETAC